MIADVSTRLDDSVKCGAVDDQVAQDWKGTRSKWFDVDFRTVFEVTHVQLASRGGGLGAVSFTVDHHRAHAADAFTAIMVERHRRVAVTSQFLV